MNYQDRSPVRFSIAIVVSLLFLVACQSDPDPTGIGLVPDGDLINALRFDSQRDSTDIRDGSFFFHNHHASSTALAIGAADGYASSALLRWLYFSVDSIQAYGGQIVSARLQLRSLPYHIGDISAPVQLDLHKIRGFWNVFTIAADSVDELRSDERIGRFDGVIGPTDSIVIDIDTATVRQWMRNSIEGQYAENHGVMLDIAQQGVLRSFQSNVLGNDSPPVLTIIMQTPNGLDTVVGEGMDNTYLIAGPKREDEGRIVLQGGISVRGTLRFDLSRIPPASVINHATLYLTKDPSLSTRYFRGADSVLVYERIDSSTNILSSSGIITRLDNSMPGVLIAEGTPLTRAVQNWVNGKGNYGLVLVPMYEVSDIDRMALHGAAAAADKRPRLVVTYTSQP
ncbi:MAG: hypothetical protein RBU27_09830 [Bacteroidota bacterium]|jgi:hypothetical protein|nr:hypothetical protein [Bacteroidota bacterium]